ncbi:hypothetical protein [Sphingomonas sp.]|uniref:hypothetical protein n=1 Tax=Sphingomonas sp. TaxID=28214 RepID=UPI003B00DF33
MARLLKTPFGYRINLDASVGKGGANGRSDVGTLQFALRQIYRANDKPDPYNTGTTLKSPDGGVLEVDGGYGPQTSDYIEAYQTWRRMRPEIWGQLPGVTGVFEQGGLGWRFMTPQNDAVSAYGRPLVDQMTTVGFVPQWLLAQFIGT